MYPQRQFRLRCLSAAQLLNRRFSATCSLTTEWSINLSSCASHIFKQILYKFPVVATKAIWKVLNSLFNFHRYFLHLEMPKKKKKRFYILVIANKYFFNRSNGLITSHVREASPAQVSRILKWPPPPAQQSVRLRVLQRQNSTSWVPSEGPRTKKLPGNYTLPISVLHPSQFRPIITFRSGDFLFFIGSFHCPWTVFFISHDLVSADSYDLFSSLN